MQGINCSMDNKVKIWLDLAIDDLQSAKILYTNGNYRSSVLFFQQSSEKGNKALAFFHGELTDKDVREASHDQLKIYRKIISGLETKIKQLSKQIDFFPKRHIPEYISSQSFLQHSETLNDDIKSIDKIRNSDLLNLSLSDINAIIKSLVDLKDIQIQTPTNPDSGFKKHMLGIINWMAQFENDDAKKAADEFSMLLNDKNKIKQLYDAIMKGVLPKLVDFGYIIMTLFFCAIITYKHISISRYPDSGIDPMKFYRKGLPLVKKQPSLMEFLEDALCRLRKIVIHGR